MLFIINLSYMNLQSQKNVKESWCSKFFFLDSYYFVWDKLTLDKKLITLIHANNDFFSNVIVFLSNLILSLNV